METPKNNQELVEIRVEGFSIFATIEVLTTWFSCDYASCHGACCWEKHPIEKLSGGIVLPHEKEQILNHPFLLAEKTGLDYIDLFEKHDGYYTTVLDENDRCVFCGLRGCYLKEIPGTDIPVHCELHPISACYEAEYGTEVLRFDHLFEKWCWPSFKKGRLEDTTLIEFEKRPLVKLFGEQMYEQLRIKAREFMEGKNFGGQCIWSNVYE